MEAEWIRAGKGQPRWGGLKGRLRDRASVYHALGLMPGKGRQRKN